MCVLVKRITICPQSLAALEWAIEKNFRLFFMLLNVCGSIRSYLELNLRHDKSYVSGSTKCLEAVRSVCWLKYNLEGDKDPCIRSKMVQTKYKNCKYIKLFKSWYICFSSDCLRQKTPLTVPDIASHFMSFISCHEESTHLTGLLVQPYSAPSPILEYFYTSQTAYIAGLCWSLSVYIIYLQLTLPRVDLSRFGDFLQPGYTTLQTSYIAGLYWSLSVYIIYLQLTLPRVDLSRFGDFLQPGYTSSAVIIRTEGKDLVTKDITVCMISIASILYQQLLQT